MPNISKRNGLQKQADRLERVTLAEARDMLYENFRTNLRVLRAGKGLSGVDAGFAIGLKNGKRIIDLEYGRANPTIEEVVMIAKYFLVEIDSLLHKKAKVILE